MTSYEVRCVIAASPAEVWEQLTDARALVNGGLGIVRLDGSIVAGGALTLWSVANPKRPFALRVSEFAPPGRMVWQGGMPLGLFKGVRVFTLTARPEGTEFHMREDYSGLLAPLIVKSIPDLTPSFEQFASGLRALAERGRRREPEA